MADPVIRPAVSKDLKSICNLLHKKMDQKISPERWGQLMRYEWMVEKPDFGRVIEFRGEILGYLGMVYAIRTINKQKVWTVSLSGWYLDKSLRGEGFGKLLMVDAIADRSMVYTMITVSSKVIGLVYDLGYQVLDEYRYIWHKQNDLSQRLSLVIDPDKIFANLSAEHQQIFTDHAQLPVMPILVQDLNENILLYFSVKKKAGGVLYYDVLYTSDITFLGDYGQSLANALLTKQSCVLAADCRFAKKQSCGAQLEQLSVPRFYKAEKLPAENIDYLYSELQLLDLKLD